MDNDGRVCSWPWGSPEPLSPPYPLEAELGLSHERVKTIAGRLLRVTVLTESGKVRVNLTYRSHIYMYIDHGTCMLL